jgi:zinc transport system ATP-binding protein
MDEALVRCEALVVGWGGRGLLPPIDVELCRGSFVVVVGRNGSGKSTWFKTLLGLIPPVSGHVRHAKAGLRLAYVPQTSGIDDLLPLRAFDVVMQGRLAHWSFLRPFASRPDRRACEQALQDAEAQDLARRRFRDLSRGQRQRVLFARMLATEADLALLDEPTAAMDVLAEQAAVERLVRLSRQRNMAIVVASHALDVTTEHADRLLLVDAGAQTVLFDVPERVRAHESYQRYLERKEPRRAE